MNVIDDLFKRVVFDQDDRDYHFKAYATIKDLANEIDSKCPDSDAKQSVFQALHLGLMYLGAALSKQEKYRDDNNG